MSRAAAKKQSEPLDYEAMALKARQARVDKCSAALQEVLKEHRCALQIGIQLGEHVVGLNQIVALPGIVQIVAQ